MVFSRNNCYESQARGAPSGNAMSRFSGAEWWVANMMPSRLLCAFLDRSRQGPKSVQNLFELGLSLLEGRVFAIDVMHFHLEGHGRHSAVRAGLGNQVIALRGLPAGVFRVASLRLATYQTAGLIAKCDILRAKTIDPHP